MAWSDIFPVLTPNHLSYFKINATKEEKLKLGEFFRIKAWFNRSQAEEIISTSLFWKNLNITDPDTPIPTRELFQKSAQKRGSKELIHPWEHYVVPLLAAAESLRESGRNAVFRVYLASDLEFLVPDLVSVGCEVALMKHPSIRHNPGAMWRYLALSDAGKCLVTFTDADRAGDFLPDLERTRETARAGLGFWRVPTWGEVNSLNKVAYRPILGCQLGACKKVEVKLLMEALVWLCENGKIRRESV